MSVELPELPDEIIVEILTWLPAKALLRFRCVCKPWRALISNSSFVQKNLIRANRLNKLFLGSATKVTALSSKGDGVAIIEQPHEYPVYMDLRTYPKIYGSSNGLVCLQIKDIILWNPCTREFKQLPEPESGSLFDELLLLAGFGYDSTIEDYKIIHGTQAYDVDDDGNCSSLEEVKLQVFTLKTGSWRTIPDFSCISPSDLKRGPNFMKQVRPGTLLNETLHWLVEDSIDSNLRLWSVGLAEEKFQVMAEFPCKNWSTSSSSPSIMTDGNSLFLHWDSSILVLKECEAEAWTKIIDISLDDLPQHFDYLGPLCILENGDVLIKNRGTKLLLYNPEKKTFRNVNWNFWLHAVYAETLVSPRTCIVPAGMEKDGDAKQMPVKFLEKLKRL